MKKLLPVILILVGIGAGGAAGLFLKPSDDAHDQASAGDEAHKEDGDAPDTAKTEDDSGHGGSDTDASKDDDHAAPTKSGDGHGEPAGGEDFVKLNKQFVVPVVSDDRIKSMVVLSIAIATERGNSETIYHYEPRLRNEILKVLFRHANSGGFDGVFTSGRAMEDLYSALNIVLDDVLGDIPSEALVTEIMRQDV